MKKMVMADVHHPFSYPDRSQYLYVSNRAFSSTRNIYEGE